MITLTLNESERQQQTIFKTTADRRLHKCCQAILMAVRQRRHGRKQLIVRSPPLQDPCSHPFGRLELESARKEEYTLPRSCSVRATFKEW